MYDQAGWSVCPSSRWTEEQGQVVLCWWQWWASHTSKCKRCWGEQSKNAEIPSFHIPFDRKCSQEWRTLSPLAPCQFVILHCGSVHKQETNLSLWGYSRNDSCSGNSSKLLLSCVLAGDLVRNMAVLSGSAAGEAEAHVGVPPCLRNCSKAVQG